MKTTALVVALAVPLVSAKCVDDPKWNDIPCDLIEHLGLCKKSWMQHYTDSNGLSPIDCCCACGGGIKDECEGIFCTQVVCPDGSLPPIPEGECCGDMTLCPDECADVFCPEVACPDGSMPPVPDGECCGDLDLCPDSCANVLCAAVVCPDGSEPPVPEGECCGDITMCPEERRLEDEEHMVAPSSQEDQLLVPPPYPQE